MRSPCLTSFPYRCYEHSLHLLFGGPCSSKFGRWIIYPRDNLRASHARRPSLLPKPPAGCPDRARRKRIDHGGQYLHDPRDQSAICSIKVLALALLARRRKAKNFGWLDRTGLRQQSVGDRKYPVHVSDLRTCIGWLSNAQQHRSLRVWLSTRAAVLNVLGLS
jgi:hypothetical protein